LEGNAKTRKALQDVENNYFRLFSPLLYQLSYPARWVSAKQESHLAKAGVNGKPIREDLVEGIPPADYFWQAVDFSASTPHWTLFKSVLTFPTFVSMIAYGCKEVMNKKRISQAEWEVLNVLWEHPNATARDVYEALIDTKKWNQKTVGTFLTRLVDKGVVVTRADGRAFRYRSRLSREKSITSESESFLQRVFRGAAGPMLAHFCEQTKLTSEEIVRLEKILRRKKE
jgi:BlaI family penicillinase repressor